MFQLWYCFVARSLVREGDFDKLMQGNINCDVLFVAESRAIVRYIATNYEGLNLLGSTPQEKAMVDQWSCRAIVRYIATNYEGLNLLGSTPQEKAMVDQWVEVEAHSFEPPVLEILGELYFGPKVQKVPDVAVVEENITKLEKVLDIYDAQLAKSKYLAGDFYSMADLVHIPMLHRFVTSTGKESLVTSRKHVHAWYENISSRPAWKKIVEQYPDL
ncbi:hypothetical protein Mapa_013679 [Marchantia paleacea]|nr:hypothetical protein Mapa_013679 [Marchantia paleacea]